MLATGTLGGIVLGKQLYSKPTLLLTPSLISHPTSTPDITANWKTYANKDLGFSIAYPPKLKISLEPNSHDINLGSWTFNLDDRKDGDGTTITTSVSVQFDKNPVSGESYKPITDINSISVGNEVTHFTLQNYPAVKSKIESTDKNGKPAETELFLNILKGKTLWFLYGHIKSVQPNDVAEIDQILSTFKFLTPCSSGAGCPPPTSCQQGYCVPPASPSPMSNYTCPNAQYVDCMPSIGATKPQCDRAYLTWATANCPNFKGAAY